MPLPLLSTNIERIFGRYVSLSEPKRKLEFVTWRGERALLRHIGAPIGGLSELRGEPRRRTALFFYCVQLMDAVESHKFHHCEAGQSANNFPDPLPRTRKKTDVRTH
jgi:hypothetical protein